jgi:hypothetical protein
MIIATGLLALITLPISILLLGPLGFGLWVIILFITIWSQSSSNKESREQKRHDEMMEAMKR